MHIPTSVAKGSSLVTRDYKGEVRVATGFGGEKRYSKGEVDLHLNVQGILFKVLWVFELLVVKLFV